MPHSLAKKGGREGEKEGGREEVSEGEKEGGRESLRAYSGKKMTSDKIIKFPLAVSELVSSGTPHWSNWGVIPHIYTTTGVKKKSN